jgi:protein O-GlcNAc transferase
MPDSAQTIAEAKRHHQAGNLHAAERLYRQALEAEPNHAEALYYLGILHSQRGLFEQAIEFLGRACAINARQPVYCYALANAHLERGEYDEAAAGYRRAIRLHHDFPDAHNNLGIALERSGKLREAVRSYRQAVRLRPDGVSALVNLGNAHRRLGDTDQAEECYRKAIGIDPSVAEAHNNLGNILQRRGEIDQAIGHLTEAIDLQPDYAAAVNNLAGAYKAKNEHDKAVEYFRRARTLAPRAAVFALNLGNTLADMNRTEEAIDQYRQAVDLDGGLVEARWRRRLALPLLYDREEEIDEWRRRFARGLDELIEETDTRDEAVAAAAVPVIAAITNFYLNYQGRNDRDLQQRYGVFVHELMSTAHPRWTKPRTMFSPGKDGRIRIGFVSAHFRYHAATRMVLSFLRDGDRKSFKYYCYHTGSSRDDFTGLFMDVADGWYENAGDLEAMCKRITSDRPHVLIYTDVGMQGAITRLAALRLAPVQCALWGHPMTSGSPTMDYFLTSALMEPADGDEHYTEQLVRLPNLGVKYIRPQLPGDPKSREALDLPAHSEAVVYLSCQSLYKYLPQHDHLFVDIARRVPKALFAFTSARSQAVTEQFRRRVHRAFEQGGLDPERHCRVFSRLEARTDFLALHMASDVCLDTLEWSGGNTTIESLTAGLPVVTLPGPFMRGRHACGMLRMLGLDELIAADKDEYVQIAVRLGLDEAYRRSIAEQVGRRCESIFEDLAPVRALEETIRGWVHSAGS